MNLYEFLSCFMIKILIQETGLEVPGTAIHLYDFAVLDQHLMEVVPHGILLGHSQIPPLYGAGSPP